MKDLIMDEMKEINGGGPESMNYIGGLAPAIPPSGGAFFAGFIKGFIKAIFS